MLAEFGFSQSLIDEITAFLGTSSDNLGESHLDVTVSGQSFGASPASIGCAGDAAKAQTHVKAALADMVTGLQGYVDALKDMQNRANAVEDVTEADLKKKWQQAESCQTPDFTTAGVCTPSGANG